MNIILITGKNPLTVQSGYAHFGAALARLLTEMGHDVHLLCVGNPSSVSKTTYGTIHQIGVPLLSLFKGREMATLPWSAFFLAQAIPSSDLVWGIGPWTVAGVIAKRAPVVADYFTTIHHEYHLPLISLLERLMLLQCKQIITHYLSTELILHQEFGFTEFTRLPYSVMTKRVIHKKTTKKILLTICRNDPRKGIPYLVQAYDLLKRKHIRFTPMIIGPGQPMGPVADVTPLLATSYAFILPSTEEGGGSIAVLEAMAAGIPIIASRIDGIPEDVKDGVSGILVPPKHPRALARAMQYLLTHPSRAKLMGRHAKKAFQKKYADASVKRKLRSFLTSFRTSRPH